ncbi:hypothetical protein [Enterococcus sp. DIV0756]|uniref:hypothetical protein n=1 Tax=Enterococcus sp. DIV0756 TaxID=2774636 RepID=UPI003F28B640
MKTIEQKKPLLQRNLFGMKRATLEAKLISYFEFSQDIATFMKYLVIVMVRNSLVVSDYSFLCQELVCDLFLTADPSDVLRAYCAYFKDYFKKSGDWDKVVHRLFADKKDYYRSTEEARSHKRLMDAKGTEEAENPDLTLRIVSTFEDASGKKHSLTIADADETRSTTELYKILAILTTIPLFKTADGVRRFAKLVKAKRPGTKETLKEVEQQADQQTESVQQPESEVQEVKTIEIVVPEGVDPSMLNEQEVLTMARIGHPDVVSLENIHVVFIEQVSEPDESVKKQEPLLEPTKESIVPPNTASDRTASKNTPDQSDPPVTSQEKRKKPKFLTPRAAYIQKLIAKKMKDKDNEASTS